MTPATVNETDPDGLWIFGVSFSWGGSRGGINVSFLINGWLAYTFGLFQHQQAQKAAAAAAAMAPRTVSGSGSSPQQSTTDVVQKLADISDLIKGRDGSSDGAPTKYPFIWYGAEKKFREAVENN